MSVGWKWSRGEEVISMVDFFGVAKVDTIGAEIETGSVDEVGVLM